MLPTFTRWFIPSKSNDYRPYFLRTWPVAILLFVIVGLYGAARVTEWYVTTPASNLAAVVSAVLVDLANTDRAQNDLATLAMSPTLTAVAQAKANDMAAQSYFAHTSPAGVTPWFWFQKEGYPFAYAGENLAVYFTDSSAVNTAWMNSPEHRANILSSHFTEIGIATAEGVYQGQPTTFVVQEFGAPVRPTPTPQPLALATSTPHAPTKPAPHATSTPVAATTTPSLVKGEATSSAPALTIIHEDATFIAVKSASSTPAPSAYVAAAQSSFFDRLITSPMTNLSTIYIILSVITALALALMIGIEIREQRPYNLFLGILILLVMSFLMFGIGQPVVASAFSGLL